MNITIAVLLLALPLAQGDTDYIVRGRTGSQNSCGPDSLYVVLRTFGQLPDLASLREGMDDHGTDLLNLQKLAEAHGLEAVPIQATAGSIPRIATPFILHGETAEEGHFITMLARSGEEDDEKWLVYDNAGGMVWLTDQAVLGKYRPSGAALSFNPAEIQKALAKSTPIESVRKAIIFLCVSLGMAYMLFTGVRRYLSNHTKAPA
jgi:ABC-type bacteriocin/lantibiotic exporter with double-glycine peptidase domain